MESRLYKSFLLPHQTSLRHLKPFVDSTTDFARLPQAKRSGVWTLRVLNEPRCDIWNPLLTLQVFCEQKEAMSQLHESSMWWRDFCKSSSSLTSKRTDHVLSLITPSLLFLVFWHTFGIDTRHSMHVSNWLGTKTLLQLAIQTFHSTAW